MKNLKNQKPSNELIEAAKTVFLAMTYEQTTREIVEPLQTSVLNKHQFKNAKTGQAITDLNRTYLMNDSDFKIYLSEVHELYIENGFNVKPDYCPLLIAEEQTRAAKRELVKAAEYLTNIKYNELIYSPKNYKKLIELTLRLCAAFIKSKDVDKWLKQL